MANNQNSSRDRSNAGWLWLALLTMLAQASAVVWLAWREAKDTVTLGKQEPALTFLYLKISLVLSVVGAVVSVGLLKKGRMVVGLVLMAFSLGLLAGQQQVTVLALNLSERFIPHFRTVQEQELVLKTQEHRDAKLPSDKKYQTSYNNHYRDFTERFAESQQVIGVSGGLLLLEGDYVIDMFFGHPPSDAGTRRFQVYAKQKLLNQKVAVQLPGRDLFLKNYVTYLPDSIRSSFKSVANEDWPIDQYGDIYGVIQASVVFQGVAIDPNLFQ